MYTIINKEELRFLHNEGKVAKDAKILPNMWVYTYKFDADMIFMTFKTRIVASGDLQNTIDETYAAILAAQDFRATIAISTAYKYKVR